MPHPMFGSCFFIDPCFYKANNLSLRVVGLRVLQNITQQLYVT